MEISSSRYPLYPLPRPVARTLESHRVAGTPATPNNAALAEYITHGEHLRAEEFDYRDAVQRARMDHTVLPHHGSVTQPHPASHQVRQALAAYASHDGGESVTPPSLIDNYV